MSFVTVFSGSDATNAALKQLVAIARGGAVGKAFVSKPLPKPDC